MTAIILLFSMPGWGLADTCPRDTVPGSAERNPFGLRIWSDRPVPVFRIGEHMVLRFSVNRPAYVTVIAVNGIGRIDTLYPNEIQKPDQLLAGAVLSVPPVDSEYRLLVQPPSGVTLVKAIATNEPVVLSAPQIAQRIDMERDGGKALTLQRVSPELPASVWSVSTLCIDVIP